MGSFVRISMRFICFAGDTLISKAIASTKRDDIHYKDHKGLRKQEQGWSDKCKRQWLKVQRERREFINQMHRAADERDKHKRRKFSASLTPNILYLRATWKGLFG